MCVAVRAQLSHAGSSVVVEYSEPCGYPAGHPIHAIRELGEPAPLAERTDVQLRMMLHNLVDAAMARDTDRCVKLVNEIVAKHGTGGRS